MAMAKKASTARKAPAKKSTTKKSVAKKAPAKKPAAKKTTTTKKAAATKSRGNGKRELIDTGTDKRYVRRRGDGTFSESDDVSRSLSADRRRQAKTVAKPGQGDRGDRKR